MKLKVDCVPEKIDDFTLFEEEFCVDKDYNVFEVWVSNETYVFLSCMGRMRAVVKDGEVLAWIYPLMSAPDPYDLIKVSDMRKWARIMEGYELAKR